MYMKINILQNQCIPLFLIVFITIKFLLCSEILLFTVFIKPKSNSYNFLNIRYNLKMLNMRTLCKFQIVILILITLTSCTTIKKTISGESSTGVGDITASQRLQISIPLPEDTKYVKEKTIIFGEGSRFSGSLYLIHEQNIDEIVEFYRNNMRGDGWQEIGMFRSNFILLNFEKENRFSTIKINPRMFDTSSSEITVGPKSNIVDDTSVEIYEE